LTENPKVSMSIGNDFKFGFQTILDHAGCTVLVHKEWGTPKHKTTEVRGLKNNEKNRLDKVMFQFPEALDICVGDILQQKGARELWRVTEVLDEIHGDVYVNFEAKVEKLSGAAPRKEGSSVIVQGSVYGGTQLDSPHASQNISVQVLQVDENINRLRQLLQSTSIPSLDKEEASLALDRISQLTRKEKSPDLLKRIKEKLDFVKVTFDLAKETVPLAAPYISEIWKSIAS
jgi:hypothetical protein